MMDIIIYILVGCLAVVLLEPVVNKILDLLIAFVDFGKKDKKSSSD